DDGERPDDRGCVREHMAGGQVIHSRKMGERRRADLAFVRPVGAVGDEIDAELAFGCLDGGINLAGRHAMAFGVQLEMLDRRLHRALHLSAAGRHVLLSATATGPRPSGWRSLSRHCFMIRTDWRISSMRTR